MLWVVLAVMTIAAAAALLVPWRRQSGALPRAAYDLEIYRDQLNELEREKSRGLIGDREAAAARAEIARRALAADAAAKGPAASSSSLPTPAFAVAVLAPVAALALYLFMGSPGIPGQPFVERLAEGAKRDDELVATLAARLRQNPDDLQGWALLARSYTTLGRIADALPAWRNVMRLAQDKTEFASQFGEALVQAADGTVTPEAVQQFEIARKADPGDPRARYYLGMARDQAGDRREALQMWTDLVALSPADAPWLPIVRERMRRVAGEAKIDLTTMSPSAEAREMAAANRVATMPEMPAGARGPSAADMEAAQSMSAEDRTTMIRGMVEQLAARLENEPNDLEGWRRLARARQVLGEADKAVEANARAAALAPERLDVLIDYAGALFVRLAPGQKLPPDFVAVMRRILALDPNHGDALWFVGMAEAEAGNRTTALAHWQKLLDRLPPNAAERREVQQQVDRLKSAN
jgi:cytochrome c-type biogenesis protein CcmH